MKTKKRRLLVTQETLHSATFTNVTFSFKITRFLDFVHSLDRTTYASLTTATSTPDIYVCQQEIMVSRVRDSVTNNNGFRIGRFDLLALLLQLHLITITYNSSQSVTT
jgi:hypothetical protein